MWLLQQCKLRLYIYQCSKYMQYVFKNSINRISLPARAMTSPMVPYRYGMAWKGRTKCWASCVACAGFSINICKFCIWAVSIARRKCQGCLWLPSWITQVSINTQAGLYWASPTAAIARCMPQKPSKCAEAALERTVRKCLVFANLHVLVILNHANSSLGRAVARFDKSGFWSNILQKPAGLQPLKVFFMEFQCAEDTISSWTFCCRTEVQNMWGSGSNFHCGAPLPKVKPVIHISPATWVHVVYIYQLGFAQAWQQPASLHSSQQGEPSVNMVINSNGQWFEFVSLKWHARNL